MSENERGFRIDAWHAYRGRFIRPDELVYCAIPGCGWWGRKGDNHFHTLTVSSRSQHGKITDERGGKAEV